jgi:hypothetical protein
VRAADVERPRNVDLKWPQCDRVAAPRGVRLITCMAFWRANCRAKFVPRRRVATCRLFLVVRSFADAGFGPKGVVVEHVWFEAPV